MTTETLEKVEVKIKGGEFLIKETEAKDVFIPEEFSEDQKNIAQMCADFLKTEVLPKMDALDSKEEGLMQSLLDKSGELGLLSTAIPEAYGGFGQDFITNNLLAETLGPGHSFAVSFLAHSGIGTLPILYFGNKEQKEKYLPKLSSGEWKAAYALTEPGSGSDALAAKTKAILSDDKKHYILNGQKIWITNAGFADVFIVFAQADDNQFTGFIVEKEFGGITLGEEEHKMGINGSSTRQVFFTDTKVPVENLLGEIGKGHLIAFNILNFGRIKLCAAALGSAKKVIDHSVKYANERIQFKVPIAKFGAIKHKLAEQVIRTFACESALYRASKDIQVVIDASLAEGKSYEEAWMLGAKEFAIECAFLKVFGSEILDYVVDEGVQIFGGYGYSAEYPVERAYRDARINRIFEGTNEINRLLTFDMLMKRAMKGELDIMGPAKAVQHELMSIPDFGEADTSLFAEEKKYVGNLKKAVLMCAGASAQKFMQELQNEQEIIMNIADMIMITYICESLLLRVEKMVDTNGEENNAIYLDIMRVYINDNIDNANSIGKNIINSFAEGDESRMMHLGLKRFTKTSPYNSKDARRRIAAKLIEDNSYKF